MEIATSDCVAVDARGANIAHCCVDCCPHPGTTCGMKYVGRRVRVSVVTRAKLQDNYWILVSEAGDEGPTLELEQGR